MIKFIIASLLLATLVPSLFAQEAAVAAPPSAEAEELRELAIARRACMRAAQVMAAEGQIVRDRVENLHLAGGEVAWVPLLLFSKNEYCFLVGDSRKERGLRIELSDPAGNVIPVAIAGDDAAGVLGACCKLQKSGRYLLTLRNIMEKPVAISLTYSYR